VFWLLLASPLVLAAIFGLGMRFSVPRTPQQSAVPVTSSQHAR